MKTNTQYVYCICRIDKKHWTTINSDLKCGGYKNIKAYIPTIRILKKSKNNRNFYIEVPLLFNYGFVRMSSTKAFDRQYLRKLKKDIPGILGWLKSLETMHPKKKRARIDNPEDFDDFSKVAIVSKEEVKYYKRVLKQNRVYTSEDIINLKLGSYVVLKGYPFEGIGATILEVNLNLKLVKVALYPDSANIIVQIPMDNVFYSIYNDFDENKLMASNDFIQENIDSEKVEQFLLKNQY